MSLIFFNVIGWENLIIICIFQVDSLFQYNWNWELWIISNMNGVGVVDNGLSFCPTVSRVAHLQSRCNLKPRGTTNLRVRQDIHRSLYKELGLLPMYDAWSHPSAAWYMWDSIVLHPCTAFGTHWSSWRLDA